MKAGWARPARMTLVPRTLVGQTVAILLAGVLLSNLIGLALYGGWPPDLLTNPRGRALAEQIEGLATAWADAGGVAGAPRPWRQPGLRVWRSERPLLAEDRPTWRTRLFRRVLLAALADDADTVPDLGGEVVSERLRLAQAPRRDMARPLAGEGPGGGWGWRRPGGGRSGEGGGSGGEGLGPATDAGGGDVEVLAGALRLEGGAWLNFITPARAVEPLWAAPAFAFGLTATSVLAAIAVWATRRATRPLAGLAQACERLGRDLAAPPVADAGPEEVRAAARAFNRMQRDLAALVRDRTRMLAAISHDLRTPLTRLRLRLELIEDEEARRRGLADLDEMQAMITATLAFARDDQAAEPRTWLDLEALLATVCDEAADIGGDVLFRAGENDEGAGGGERPANGEDEGARPGTARGPGRLSCLGRPLALKRAFANLIGNAVVHGGGAVVSVDGDTDEIIVMVEDDGPGLPEDQLERVFEPFVRGDGGRGGGVGLGLPIARAIIAAHGGTLTLANRAAGGLRACVRLPRSQPQDVDRGAADGGMTNKSWRRTIA